jgi:predicted glycosyltransferase
MNVDVLCCAKNILYAMIGEPFVIGSDQVIDTLSLIFAVSTVIGASGTKAQSSVITLE